MVLYYPDGRVVKQHEDYLEREAAKKARHEDVLYEEQIDVCKKHDPTATEGKVSAQIVIDTQNYYTLYTSERGGSLWEELEDFRVEDVSRIPEERIDRTTLMKCSATADEFFRYNPGETDLHLPLRYPRRHVSGERAFFTEGDSPMRDNVLLYPGLMYNHRDDDQMAYIRKEELLKYIIPWLKKMTKHFARLEKEKGRRSKKPSVVLSSDSDLKSEREHPHKDQESYKSSFLNPAETIERVEIPDDLLEKIHLYNAMLQLGLPSFIQRPLIDELVAQMYNTRLENCHLETLEMTVARFHSQSVAVLDPVLSHLIGTYSLRSIQDRNNTGPEDSPYEETTPDAGIPRGDALATEQEEYDNDDDDDESDDPFDFRGSKRRLLQYAQHPAERHNYPDDTIVLPPKLPVLGHSIRHWSGIRRNGSTAAAYTGFPLNVGRVKKYYRRKATHPVHTTERNTDFVEYSTYRLKNDSNYQQYPPGGSKENDTAKGELDAP